MVETVEVRISGAQKEGVLYHGEKEELKNWFQHYVVYVQGLLSAGERETLEFEPRQVKSGNGAFAESNVVRQHNRRIRFHAVH